MVQSLKKPSQQEAARTLEAPPDNRFRQRNMAKSTRDGQKMEPSNIFFSPGTTIQPNMRASLGSQQEASNIALNDELKSIKENVDSQLGEIQSKMNAIESRVRLA